MEALFSEAEAKEQRAKELKGAWLRDQFAMLRKAINMTPRFRDSIPERPEGRFRIHEGAI